MGDELCQKLLKYLAAADGVYAASNGLGYSDNFTARQAIAEARALTADSEHF